MRMKLGRYQTLTDEYNDLTAEFLDCDDHDERCRCAKRMNEITDELKREGWK